MEFTVLPSINFEKACCISYSPGHAARSHHEIYYRTRKLPQLLQSTASHRQIGDTLHAYYRILARFKLYRILRTSQRSSAHLFARCASGLHAFFLDAGFKWRRFGTRTQFQCSSVSLLYFEIIPPPILVHIVLGKNPEISLGSGFPLLPEMIPQRILPLSSLRLVCLEEHHPSSYLNVTP